ncbi:hypothetical protein BDW02DRAFT_257049 [Decorospora gaudefroyi]|uniref:Uncharacterized protein n=1 Tax=Decorospora gaudefroyi TaxID=184978 RepID=A0A6A5KG58_9PLEO|nr:hypothetical protein BDW02DRAFT_257049 [Decorospora gaudefroyi]
MSPPKYIFRIDEIREANAAPATVGDVRNDWVPSMEEGANIRVGGGVSGQLWCCNGHNIGVFPAQNLPTGAKSFETYSVFYSGGFGFWVLKGDATTELKDGTTWQPLRFEHDRDDDYSSYLCNVAQDRILASRRADQFWPQMLLPDIYWEATPVTPYAQYGGLKGELAIFLALVAFAMQPAKLPSVLPKMFENREWKVWKMPHGREERRGVVVYVYTWPDTTEEDLINYENGEYNARYYR